MTETAEAISRLVLLASLSCTVEERKKWVEKVTSKNFVNQPYSFT